MTHRRFVPMNLPSTVLHLVLIMLVAGCAQQEIVQREVPPRPAREDIVAFSLSGRAIINRGGKADTVRLMWDHSPAFDTLGFASPIGTMLAELQRDRQGARWTSADGDTYSARSADALMARLTDTPVPIDALALWVTGRTSRDALAIRRDSHGRLVNAIDGDWTIQVLGYENDLPNALPSTLEARSSGLVIRLAIEEWQL